MTTTAPMTDALALLDAHLRGATLDREYAEQAIERATANLAEATAQRDQAQRTIEQLGRLKALAEGG